MQISQINHVIHAFEIFKSSLLQILRKAGGKGKSELQSFKTYQHFEMTRF